jgi:uncharacterized membrane protein YfcA
MSALNILLAVVAAGLVGYAVNQQVEAQWVGPVAAGVIMGALIGIERARKGKRDAR